MSGVNKNLTIYIIFLKYFPLLQNMNISVSVWTHISHNGAVVKGDVGSVLGLTGCTLASPCRKLTHYPSFRLPPHI